MSSSIANNTSILERKIAVIALLAVACGLVACGANEDSNGGADTAPAATATSDSQALPKGGEAVTLDPADFTTEIDNPYWPMSVGSEWTYRESDPEGELTVVVTVTDQVKRIANGIEARVVHDVVSRDGEPVEVTDDWYAQDADGNVWYLGEETAEYENGKVVTREGSFEAGIDGAEAGIVMPGDPRPGLTYRQEYLEGEAEDFAKVLGFALQVEVPAGRYDDVLQTEDVNPLGDPQPVENKFHAEGVGPVLTLDLTGSGREELVGYRRGG